MSSCTLETGPSAVMRTPLTRLLWSIYEHMSVIVGWGAAVVKPHEHVTAHVVVDDFEDGVAQRMRDWGCLYCRCDGLPWPQHDGEETMERATHIARGIVYEGLGGRRSHGGKCGEGRG